MTEFSPTVATVIERFAADMGVDAAVAADGSYSFTFSHWGTLSLIGAENGEDVLVSLARSPRFSDAASERRLLEAAGLDDTSDEFVHVGLAPDGTHVCIVRVNLSQFDLQRLDATLSHLVRMLDKFA